MKIVRAAARALKRGLTSWFSAVASKTGPWWGSGYNATDPRRNLLERLAFANRTMANELLSASGPTLRAYARHLERNNPTARAVIDGLKALVVGTGIALEPRSENAERIRMRWMQWIKCAGINGESLYELQAQAMSEKIVTGEMLWRYVIDPDLAARGEIPLRILPLDGEWLVDHYVPQASDGITAVNGVALDRFGRPVSYFLQNPSLAADAQQVEEVPAAWINHRFERRRPLQNRGETWFAPIIETLMNERDLVDVELFAAKMSAAPALVLKSKMPQPVDTDLYGTSSDPVVSGKLGAWIRLFPDEDFAAHSHTRPSQQIAPFRRMLRGDTAAAMRIPQRFLDRDVTRANYSSMKADQIDSGMLLGPLREAHGHDTAGDAFRHVLPWICLAEGIPLPARADYELIPDEIPYLDPQKDIGGALMAIAGGLSTWEHEIGKRGHDPREVHSQLKKELADPLLSRIFYANLNVQFGDTPENIDAASTGKEPEPITEGTENGEE